MSEHPDANEEISEIGAGLTLRLCPVCAATEPVRANESVWPEGWRCEACGRAVPTSDGIPLYAPALAQANSGFTNDVFAALERSMAGHFWFEPRNRLITGLAAKFFPASSRCLEIGCGTGMVLKSLADAQPRLQLVGSELHPAGLAHAVRRLGGRAAFVQLDARHIPARRAFDLVGAFDVLEHIVEDEEVLGEIHAVLVRGGGLIAAVPQHPALWSPADDAAHHIRRYRRGELERKMAACGFEVLFSSSYTSMLLPFMAVSRLAKRHQDCAAGGIVHELSVGPALNAMLRAVLDMEVSLTLRGWNWPVGGSRIAVARKNG